MNKIKPTTLRYIFVLRQAQDDRRKNTQGEREKTKHYFTHYLLLLFFVSINCMEQQKGPMDSVWFYDKNHIFAQANQLHQEQQWEEASRAYRDGLAKVKPTDNVYKPNESHPIFDEETKHHEHIAQLNLAACLMAQRQETEHWASFDALLDIPKPKHISSDLIHHHKKPLKEQTILVRTDHIGIGDIFCFLSAAHELKKRTDCDIVLSVPDLLKETLASAAQEYKFTLIGTHYKSDITKTTHYETHLIALLGHLHLKPAQMNPKKVVFSAPEQAMNAVLKKITPLLKQENILVVADRGEVDRQTILIGGKKLPYNSNTHGRHLDSEPFAALFKNHPNIILVDCSNQNKKIISNKNNKIIVDDESSSRYLTIAPEQHPFDTIIALARIMSAQKNMIAFGPDMGQTNVFMRALDHDAQNRMAFIIPNPKEHDMRMEGEGSKYKHMISNCWAYKCKTPDDQTHVIEEAYNDMLKIALEDTLQQVQGERDKK
ncbi:MAG TPA: hypothetical protein VHX42_04095 [Candidatus Babeliales bacterium]|nr:hypothetical protein [Candidatus Babeliales bacterium]